MPLVPLRPLDGAQVRGALVDAGTTSWTEVTVAEETGSTNSDLVQRAQHDVECDRVVLLAEYQHSGRGRYTRKFVAPPRSSVSVSCLVRTGPVQPQRWPLLPLALGVAVLDGLRSVVGSAVDLSLKWPNDVLCEGGKLSGMLVEMATVDRKRADGSPATAIIPGVGINVTQAPEELPVDYAVSLAMFLGKDTPSREEVAIAVLREFDRRVGEWRRGSSSVVEDYGDLCSTLGQEVDAQLPDGRIIRGEALDIAADGCLVLRTSVGSVSAIRAGDVRHVRGGGCYLP